MSDLFERIYFALIVYFTVLNINYIVHFSPNFGKLTFHFIKLVLTSLITILLNLIHSIAFSENLVTSIWQHALKYQIFCYITFFILLVLATIVYFTLCLRCLTKCLLRLRKNYILHLTMSSFLFNLACLELWEGLCCFALIKCFTMLPLT